MRSLSRARGKVRGLTGTLLVLAASVFCAVGTLSLVSSGAHVASRGSVPVHGSPSLQQELDDGAPTSDAGYVPVGPHLTVPILYYHYIRSIDPTHHLLGFNLSISPALFAEQMTLLHLDGAHTITLGQLVAALAGKAALPSHPVILTFDDGYADFATAAEPVLDHFGFVATDFVVSGFVGTFHYMTASQVLSMDAAGMVIGSHTVHHVDLATVPLDRARNEIDKGKAALEHLLGHPVLDFAYPYGGYDAAVGQLLQEAGFRDAVSTRWGDVHTLGGLFLLHRIEVGGAPSLATFARDALLPAPTAAQLELIAILAPTPATEVAGTGAALNRAA